MSDPGAIEPIDDSRLPPHDRRLVIVSKLALKTPPTRTQKIMMTVALNVANAILVPGLLNSLSKLYESLKDSDFNGELAIIDRSDASFFNFAIGHPQPKTLYVLHPADPRTYIVAGRFHELLFEQKVAEALKLIRCLGAETINVNRLEGWGQESGASAALDVPVADKVNVGGSFSRTTGSGRSIMTSMTLKPKGDPYVPAGLIWFPYEPLWREVAEARLTSGLKSFQIDVKTTDDFGINAQLNAEILNAGLSAGGSFVEHQSTVWRLDGTFA
jgi:hypothetical protein